MSFESSLSQSHSFTKSSHERRRKGFFYYFNNIPGIGIFFCSSFLVGLIFYSAILSPHGPSSSESYGLTQLDTSPAQYLISNKSTPTNQALSSPTSDEGPSSFTDVLSLEQIRDIVVVIEEFLRETITWSWVGIMSVYVSI